MFVSVVIPTLKPLLSVENQDWLHSINSTIQKDLKESRFEVVVVYSGTDVQNLQIEKVRFVKSLSSEFAAKVNLGIKQSKGKYIFLLNDDVVLGEGYIKTLVSFIIEDSLSAVCHGLIFDKDGNDVENAGAFLEPKGKILLIKNASNLNDSKAKGLIPIYTATATLYDRNSFEKVGLFDESFGSYLEDVDWSIRAFKMGIKGAVVQDASCRHIGQATSAKMGNYKARMDAKNWWLIVTKYYYRSFWKNQWYKILLERLRNLSGLIKETIRVYKIKSFWHLPISIAGTYIKTVFLIFFRRNR